MSGTSPAPGTPQTPHKAIVAAVVAFAGSLASSLAADAPDTGNEWLVAIVAALATAVVAGGGTYAVPNQPK